MPLGLTAAASGTRVEASWTAPADPTPGSGLAGFATRVSTSSTWTCDGMKDLEADVLALSEEVATGSWFVHLCALDGAGNRSPVASAGPVEVGIGPSVTAVDTVAGTGDGGPI